MVSTVVIYPNVVPAEIMNILILFFCSILILWGISFAFRCWHLFEGIVFFRRKDRYFVNFNGVDELKIFWAEDPIREFVRAFLKEQLPQPHMKCQRVRGVFKFHPDTLKLHCKKVFGKEHSYGVIFRFDSSVPCRVDMYWQVNEEIFNTSFLEHLKNQCDQSIFARGEIPPYLDLNELLNEEDDYMKKSPTQYISPGRDVAYLIRERDLVLVKAESQARSPAPQQHFGLDDESSSSSDENLVNIEEDLPYKNDIDTFFTSFREHKKIRKSEGEGEDDNNQEEEITIEEEDDDDGPTSSTRKEKEKIIKRSQFAQSRLMDFQDDMSPSYIPLIIHIRNLKGTREARRCINKKKKEEEEEEIEIMEEEEEEENRMKKKIEERESIKFNDEVQSMIIICEFDKKERKIKIYKKDDMRMIFHQTHFGIYNLNKIYREGDGKLCILCYSHKKIILFPCCHESICRKCLKKLQKCPNCRFMIDGDIRQRTCK